VAWPEFADRFCGGYKINQHGLWRYGVKYDNCYVTEHRCMNSKYIKYIEGKPPYWCNVKDHIWFHYFKFVTSLFIIDYSDDEINIFVPTVEKVTQSLY